jgi:hypothetical protein
MITSVPQMLNVSSGLLLLEGDLALQHDVRIGVFAACSDHPEKNAALFVACLDTVNANPEHVKTTSWNMSGTQPVELHANTVIVNGLDQTCSILHLYRLAS